MATSSADKPAPAPGRRRAVPTIRDVAQVAGVSVGTASKALNGRGQLRPETRARVQAAARHLEFRPNDLLLSLLRGRSYTVGLLTTDSYSYGRFSLPLLNGIEHALGVAKISVFLCSAGDDRERERQHIEALLAKQVDGIVVVGRSPEVRVPINVSVPHVPVLYAYTQVSDPSALCLLPDEAQGVRLAMEHLVAHGRRHIAHITGPPFLETTRLRRNTMIEILNQHAIAFPDHRFLPGQWQESWGYRAANLLLDNDRRIDAIFCGNDLIARGGTDALRERGVRVPDDVAIVGFDNWEIIAAETRPPLTTVDINLYELGRSAGAHLLTMMDGDKEAGVLRLPCSLVIRDSCGCRQDAAQAHGQDTMQPVPYVM